MRYTHAILVVAKLAGCGLLPEKVSSKDARLKPMFDAMDQVDRTSLGFTPVEPEATIRLEGRPRNGYDAMLHIDGRTLRTVAFRRIPSGYEWIGEQEIFQGPKRYKTADGESTESITITYEKVPMSGVPLDTISVQYAGENSELSWPHRLSVEEVRPVLRQWGY